MSPTKRKKAKDLSIGSIIGFLIAAACWFFGLPAPAPQAPIILPPAAPPAPNTSPADPDYIRYHHAIVAVYHVVDGDTVKFIAQTPAGHVESVRIVGIDTPETVHPSKPVQPYGPEASARARQLLSGKSIKLILPYDTSPRDRYHRLLAYVELPDGKDFGDIMLQEGLARTTPQYAHPRSEKYRLTENQAKTQQRGLWSQ